jgi:hypothetical protein
MKETRAAFLGLEFGRTDFMGYAPSVAQLARCFHRPGAAAARLHCIGRAAAQVQEVPGIQPIGQFLRGEWTRAKQIGAERMGTPLADIEDAS